ncbi:MAG: alcohol dehydrogenase [Candidatus Abyssobacteria bacterium SURF_5]|uniref:Alcohol dehydrogenase n=1 Tax=Abyssobacteria bacterium (strain SURF_5) TaxID=2093360 RepID=A0A3A4NTJ0_ABYX5|nr:MAG: alcohol dehydrogenase [Candidatus Abyssubacteria bacterium SURF_5]
MKALMLKGPRDVSLEEVPIAPAGSSGVKIRVKRGLICGTDHSMFTGSFPVPGDYPFFIGHELAGVVEEVGPNVRDIAPGQIAVTNPVLFCGECYRCRNGQQHYCERLTELWKPNGGFSEYIVVDAQQTFTVPEGISLDQAAFAEPVSVCVHCIDMADIKPGMSVAITGAGPIGLILLQLAIRSGAAFTFVSEPVASKREMARRLGADAVVDPSVEDVQEKAFAATGNKGFDVVIEASGNAQAVQDAYNITGSKASLFYFAVYPMDLTLSLSLFMLYFKELTIKGVFFSPYTFPRAINILPKLQLSDLITHRLPLERAAEAFALYETGQPIKIAIEC